MIRLKDLFNKTINKTNKEISLHLKKKDLCKIGRSLDEVLDMEIKANEDFLK